jgi:hypothetical protein
MVSPASGHPFDQRNGEQPVIAASETPTSADGRRVTHAVLP